MAKQTKQSSQSRTSSKTRSSQARQASSVEWSFPLTQENFRYFAIAFGVLVLGYALMMTANTSDPAQYLEKWANPIAIRVAPVVLVVAYCVLFPLALMKRPSGQKSETPHTGE
jgi:hypothetical protein